VLSFTAVDAAGNAAAPRIVHFTLDTVAPLIEVTEPLDGAALARGAALRGTANPNGSLLVELNYTFDDGRPVPLSFDAASGAFVQGLRLAELSVGDHTLIVTARDAAGNTSTTTRTVSVDPLPLLVIERVTPTPGSNDVGTTFRPQVFFSRPIDTSSLSSSNFFATDSAGATIPATIVSAMDDTFAWLFFSSPLPGGSIVNVHVMGNTIRAADNTQLDADDNGVAGGTFTFTFSTVSLVPLAGTSLSGKVVDPGDDLKPMTFDDIRVGPDQILHTSDDVFLHPIACVKVFVLGLEDQFVLTDANGNFHFDAVPGGTIKLAVDGRTATNVPTGFYYPEMVMDQEIEVGQANTVMGTMGPREKRLANIDRQEVYLPRLQTSLLQTVSDTEVTTIGVDGVSAPNLTEEQRQQLVLEVQPGSLIGANGQRIFGGDVGISTVPPELVREMLPPGLLQHTFDITIQAPEAAVFNTPLKISFPNVFDAAPGTQLDFLSFDHTTGRLVIEGTATVSADGLSVTTDPGMGITKPGWHGITPPGGSGG
jgi:hypothetical protein